MAVDKGLYAMPQGLETLGAQEEPVEIEIVDPESVSIKTGDMEIEIEPGEEDGVESFSSNLAEFMDSKELEKLGPDLLSDINNDEGSRKDWEDAYKEGIKLLGLKYEERTEPWSGSCGVFHPMLGEAVVRFQSETIMETFPAKGPVMTKILGDITPEKTAAANRVQEDMNYQLTEVMVEYRPEHERMLWNLPGTGSAFKKVYEDLALGRQTSVFVPAEDILLPYGCSDMNTCERITHRMRKTENELTRLMYEGFYRDIELGDPTKTTTEIQKAKDEETGFSANNDDRYVILECHVNLDLPGFEDLDKDGEPTGIALPYVVTLNQSTGDILSIYRNWREDDKLKLKRQHFVHYQYVPGYGAYGFGLFHLVGGFAKSATSIMRQLVDAGTLSNLPGGLKSRGLRIKGDDTPIAPGEFRDVDVGSGSIRDNILPLPYKEPSATLYNLLNTIVEEGRRFAATADMKISDMSAQAPVGTTLALLERQLKVMTAVQARVHYALKQEFRLIAGLVRDNSPHDYDYDVKSEYGRRAKFEDYRHTDIIPVSDPNAATLSQRVVQYQAVMQMAQQAPQIYNLPQLHRQMLNVMGIKDADKLVPLEEDNKPTDPVTENQNALQGKPLQAFAYQDHEAHIKVHQMAMTDPLVQQLIGQNPQAQVIMQAMAAHIAQHVGFAYRHKMAQAIGMPLPEYKPEDGMAEEREYQLSQMMAEAAPMVLAQSQQMVAQQQAQQNAQDPVLQAQLLDQQIKAQELQRKAQKDQMDFQLAQQKLQLEAEKIRAETTAKGAQLGANVAKSRAELNARMQVDGARLGVDIAKARSQERQKQNQPTGGKTK
jgi:hypothetical protein